MRVLIADKLAPFVSGRLQDLGADITVDPALKGEELTAALAEVDPEVVVVRSTKITAADIAAGKSLALVIRAGAGVNTIDLDAASGAGVYVANCPGKNASAVAELAIGHLLNLDRRIADNVAQLRAGSWNKGELGKARGLRGRRLAILGTGRIGVETLRIAQAIGMEVVAWSRSLDPETADELGVEYAPTPEAAVQGADAVSVHLAATPETRGRIGESVFAAMKNDAFFINTSRADVVDHAALRKAITEKNLRAGLDVFEGEPAGKTGTFTDAIADSPNVYGTHHIGASTDQAEEAVGEDVVRIVAAYSESLPIPNCVNLATRTAATHVLVARHADRVGVLASILDVLSAAGHNVEEMQNTIFSGGEAACARIALVDEPSEKTLGDISGNEHVFSVAVSPIG